MSECLSVSVFVCPPPLSPSILTWREMEKITFFVVERLRHFLEFCSFSGFFHYVFTIVSIPKGDSGLMMILILLHLPHLLPLLLLLLLLFLPQKKLIFLYCRYYPHILRDFSGVL